MTGIDKIFLGVEIALLLIWIVFGLWIRWRIHVSPDSHNRLFRDIWIRYNTILFLTLGGPVLALVRSFHVPDAVLNVLYLGFWAAIFWINRDLWKRIWRELIQGTSEEDQSKEIADGHVRKSIRSSKKENKP